MTNGEKLKEVFPDIQIFNVTENEQREKFIHIRLGGVCQAIELDWWSAEYKEPTKNDLGVDCISRKAVLDLPKRTMKNYFGEVVGEVVYVKDIMDLPSVTPQEPRWIPVNEQLPKIHNYSEAYLVTLSNGEVTEVMFTETNGKSWWERTRYKIIAWMPLPQPYREVKE